MSWLQFLRWHTGNFGPEYLLRGINVIDDWAGRIWGQCGKGGVSVPMWAMSCFSTQQIGNRLCLIALDDWSCIRAGISFHFHKSHLLRISDNVGYRQLLLLNHSWSSEFIQTLLDVLTEYCPSKAPQFSSIIASVFQRDVPSTRSRCTRSELEFRQWGTVQNLQGSSFSSLSGMSQSQS